MKNSKLIIMLISLALVVLLAAGHAMAADLSGKKVIVISGASKAKNDEVGYNLYQEGMVEGLKAAGIKPVFQWAEMSYLTADADKVKAGDAALAKIRAEKPDAIIALDDDAVKYIAVKIDDIPIVFCGVYAPPQALGLPRPNITGVIRNSYAVDNWRLAKKLFNAKTVGMLSKYSLPMAGVKQFISAKAPLLEKASGVQYKDMFMCENFDDWKAAVEKFPYDFIYVADSSRIARDGKEMPREELMKWTVDNAKVPVIAAVEKDVEGGGLLSIVTSEHNVGKLAAETTIEILNGAAPSQEYKKAKKGKLVINTKTAMRYKMDIPYEILSTADRVIE